jgi:lipoate-protein ligase A
MSEPWRLRVDPPAPGSRNMAVDEELLEGAAGGSLPPTLRFYSWSPPCLSLGYFQSEDLVDLDACRRLETDVVRRPTGGRAILHHRELTYSVCLPLSILGREQGVIASYGRISRALVDGLRAVGFPVEAQPESVDLRAESSPACFDRPAQHEILLFGRKVVGSAQVRRGGALLQHGSILFAPQVEETLRLLRLQPSERDALRSAMTAGVGGLESVRPVDQRELIEAVRRAFERAFGVQVLKEAGETTRTR